MEIITSTQNNKIKELKKLKQSKYRKQQQQFLVETTHLIDEAIKNGSLIEIITNDLEYVSDHKVTYVSPNVMKALSSLHSHSQYIGVVETLDFKLVYDKNILVLENIQDPGNLGTILRSALALGWNDLLISNNCVDLYNEKVIQASQGAIFHLNITVDTIEAIIEKLKQNDYQLIGTALDNAKDLTKDSKLITKSALFFGNEGQGLSEYTLSKMDYNYKIPINDINSLNVSVAAGIIMYQLKI